MGQIRCVRCEKLWCNFMTRTFALIVPVQPNLHRISCSNETIHNAPKHYETHQNMSLGSNGMDQVHLLRKIPMRLRGTNFCINCTSSPRFALSIMQLQNEHYETHQNMSLGSNGVDRERSLWKITMWLRGTNFCINCTSSICFAPTFMHLRNDPKCTQILRNAPKH